MKHRMNGVVFRLLTRGPGLWLDVGGRGLRAGTPKEQCLLAILLMSPNQPVSVEEISYRIWGDHPPAENHKTIDRYVTRIRGRLRRLFGDRVKIFGKQGTYTLQVDPEAVDVCRFHRLRKEASDAERRNALERAIELYRAAESLCGLDPLAGLPGAWARRMAQELRDKLFRIRRARIALELRLGRYNQALDELPGMVERHPDDQRLVGHLMTALAATGQQAQALDVYRRTRAYLAENLGIEPGQELFELHQRILGGSGGQPGGDRRGAPGPSTLPEDIPHFVGRKNELEQIATVRADHRGGGLVVIEGMPGVGKTALAVHAAHRLAARYPDARLYLDMQAHDPERPPFDARTALAALLTMLGTSSQDMPGTLDERAAMWRRHMADLRALVILDDADGLEQVLPLLPADPDQWAGLVLVTTRGRTELIPGMRRIPLNVLPDGDAAALWSRLTGERPEHGVSGRLRRLCAGLPLAITELAGRPGPATEHAPARQFPQVYEAVLRSYRRLTPERQRAFRRLGLFPGDDMTVDLVSVLTDTPPDAALAHVRALRDHHLLDEGASGRFRFHPLVRAVAHELARSRDPERDTRATGARLLRHYLRTVEAADRGMFPHRRRRIADAMADRLEAPTREAARDWFDAEWRNVLKTAHHAAEHEWQTQCAQLMHLLAEYLDFRQLFADAAAGHERAVRACRDIGDRYGLATATLDLAFARYRTAYYAEAAYQAEEAQRIYEALGRRSEAAQCLELIGLTCWERDKRREAFVVWDEAAHAYQEIGDRKGLADVFRLQAMARWSNGKYEESDRLSDEALRIYREIGDRVGEMKTLNNKGHIAQSRARHRHADLLYRQAAAICKETTGQENHAILDHNQGDLHRYKKRYETALEYYGRALAEYRQVGNRRYLADVDNAIGETYLELGRIPAALDHFTRAKDTAEQIGCRSELARALAGIAAAHREYGDYDLAQTRYGEALDLARAIDDPRLEAQIMDGAARAHLARGNADAARVSWRLAVLRYEEIGLDEFAEEIRIKLETMGGLSRGID